jgi:SNW domain-containing protein 1
MFDQRLFNQTSGIGTGFGDDEDYSLYDKPLFADRTSASIYKNVNRETGQGGLADRLSDDDGQNETEVSKVLR